MRSPGDKKQIDVLFVDDKWCLPENQHIIKSEYSDLCARDIPFVFHFETGADGDGYSSRPVVSRIAAIEKLAAVVLDIMFGDEQDRLGLDILQTIRERWPTLPVLMMSSLESVEPVERAMELGANEYLVKKPTLRELETALRTYTHNFAGESDYAIWGNSQAIRKTRALIARVSFGGTASVLITGESGTGKELIARAIHRQGPRRAGPFVDKNCAHETSDLLDSDLFGHEKGAFTGATEQHIGRIERAHKGILFLDEIGSISEGLQGKLLRVLEARQFQRLGGTDRMTSDFQLICATNQDPHELLRTGKLREDFYYRVHQFEIESPSLRDRSDDVPILAHLFLNRFTGGPGASYVGDHFPPAVITRLQRYSWPGNVRELRNVVERMAILARDREIGNECLPPEIGGLRPTCAPGAEPIHSSLLPEDTRDWPRSRLLWELRMAVEAKRRSKSAAEFIRCLYPKQTKTSTAGVKDLVRRLTSGPWGDPDLRDDPEAKQLLDELERP